MIPLLIDFTAFQTLVSHRVLTLLHIGHELVLKNPCEICSKELRVSAK